MSNRTVLITESHIENIADAIREKLSSHDTYLPADMPGAIRQIRGRDPTMTALTATINGDYTPSGDVDGFGVVTVDVPTLTASVTEDTIVLSGTPATIVDDVIVLAGAVYVHKTITANGTYQAASDSANGYSGVTVDVAGDVGEKLITQDGDYDANVDGLDGYSFVRVRVSGVAWVANVAVDSEFPYAEPTASFALADYDWTAEADENQEYPHEETVTVFSMTALVWTAEAQEEE